MSKFLFLTFALIASWPATAGNLVLNPGFVAELEPWFPFNYFDLTVGWSPLDANDDPASGSAEGTVPVHGTFRVPPFVIQCVAVAPNTRYVVGAKVLLPSESSAPNANAGVLANTYPNSGCFGNASAHHLSPTTSDKDAWTEVRQLVETGPDEGSIQLNLRVFAPSETLLRSYFDDAFIVLDDLFDNDFEP
jgi:hypothetical protein